MIHNLSAIKSKMKDKPRGQRIYAFFEGDYTKLTPRQISQMEKIIAKGHEKALAVIKKAKSEISAV
jgi:DNA primase